MPFGHWCHWPDQSWYSGFRLKISGLHHYWATGLVAILGQPPVSGDVRLKLDWKAHVDRALGHWYG